MTDQASDFIGQFSRLKLWFACVFFTSLPFLFCTFVPSVDLPQHIAHVRCMWDALRNPNSIYQVNWEAPYLLAYFVLSLPFVFLSAILAAKAGAWLLLQTWVLSIHQLGKKFAVSQSLVVLATLAAFNASFYWGFLSFYAGFPIFCLWLIHCQRISEKPLSLTYLLLTGILSAALYWTHLLWWVVAGFFFGLYFILQWKSERTPRNFFCHGAVAALPIIAMLDWYPSLAQKGFVSETLWMLSPTATLSVDVIARSTLGLFDHSWIVLVALIVILVTQFSWSKGRRPPLALSIATLLFLALALLLPEKHQNTILFSERWLAPLLIFALFSAGYYALAKRSALIVASALLLCACAFWSWQWRNFEQKELTGLRTSLDAIPENPRLLGLDFRRQSDLREGAPFLQNFAYGQAMRGGELNFTFVSFGPLPVEYKFSGQRPWTQSLEWFPQNVSARDFGYFDFALINAPSALHTELARQFPIEEVTHQQYWRLYRVKKQAK